VTPLERAGGSWLGHFSTRIGFDIEQLLPTTWLTATLPTTTIDEPTPTSSRTRTLETT
jgi:hypothetical protein